MGIIPGARPQLKREECEKIIKANKVTVKDWPCVLIGVRGYFLDSMGIPGKNDRRIYDDALFWVTPNVYASFNANVDPNGVRKGRGTGAYKGMANLKCGLWWYQKGLHRGYQAFTQADEVTVIRDGIDGDYEDTGFFAINIHQAGIVTTSSLGCQTLPPTQWPSFKGLGYGELERNKQKKFPYILIDETERRKGNLYVG